MRTSLSAQYPRVACSFELSQAITAKNGESTLPLLEKLAVFLGVKVNPIRENRTYPQFRVRTSSTRSNKKLVRYLNDFPLFSTKYLDFLDWKQVVAIFDEGRHKVDTPLIVALKAQMNDNRTYFVWDHLGRFYSVQE